MEQAHMVFLLPRPLVQSLARSAQAPPRCCIRQAPPYAQARSSPPAAMSPGCDWTAMEAQQRAWAAKVSTQDAEALAPAVLRLVGGLDVHWDPQSDDKGVAGLVLLTWPQLKVLHALFHPFQAPVPYATGFLGFRECDAYVHLFNQVRGTPLEPQLLFVDGCGVLHPRSCGSASQLGLLLGAPTIGISKTLNSRSLLTDQQVKQLMLQSGSLEHPLVDADGTVVGVSVRKSAQHRQPVHVSVGHQVSLETAVALAQQSCLFKLPEPVRQADILTRQHAQHASSGDGG